MLSLDLKDQNGVSVGIIANPAASKDIRRLVAQGRVIPDWEKVNIIRRVLIGLQATGIQLVFGMPDASNLCRRSTDDKQVSLDVELVDIPAYNEESDTIRSVKKMRELGVACIVTLGGDGTNRAVSTESEDIPLVAISTGTNNVFPTMVEGTLAGLAAGLVALGKLTMDIVSTRSKRYKIYVDGVYRDMALVDVAFSQERFVASRAIWDMDTLYEVFLTRAEPANIGLASVGAALKPISIQDQEGLRYGLYPDTNQVNLGDPKVDHTLVVSTVAPGMVKQISIADWNLVQLGERVHLERRHATVALDGERSFSVTPDQDVEIELNSDGPIVINVESVLNEASRLGVFRLSGTVGLS